MNALKVVKSAVVFACLAIAPVAWGQAAQIAGGTTTLKLDSSFVNAFNGSGITIAAVSPSVMSSPNIDFYVSGGVADTTRGIVEIQHRGGLEFNLGNGAVIIHMENLTFDNSSGNFLVTADVVVNGIFEGREPIFAIASKPQMTSTGGFAPVMTIHNANLVITNQFVSELRLRHAPIADTASVQTIPVGTVTVRAYADPVVAGQ